MLCCSVFSVHVTGHERSTEQTQSWLWGCHLEGERRGADRGRRGEALFCCLASAQRWLKEQLFCWSCGWLEPGFFPIHANLTDFKVAVLLRWTDQPGSCSAVCVELQAMKCALSRDRDLLSVVCGGEWNVVLNCRPCVELQALICYLVVNEIVCWSAGPDLLSVVVSEMLCVELQAVCWTAGPDLLSGGEWDCVLNCRPWSVILSLIHISEPTRPP